MRRKLIKAKRKIVASILEFTNVILSNSGFDENENQRKKPLTTQVQERMREYNNRVWNEKFFSDFSLFPQNLAQCGGRKIILLILNSYPTQRNLTATATHIHRLILFFP